MVLLLTSYSLYIINDLWGLINIPCMDRTPVDKELHQYEESHYLKRMDISIDNTYLTKLKYILTHSQMYIFTVDLFAGYMF